ncbi:MAG TPA: lamin tail domain-containing protein [Candidatus Eisenbacteria bacterium]|nr:lamin tail domain-containing protein [Candidatus Eisenbacteria bacterium]
MLKLALVGACALAVASTARADLVLNEVLYDPDGADEGHEFVELWNPDSVAVPLDGVALETSDGARPGTWAVVWRANAGDIAGPRSPFVVGAARLLAALQNGPDAIRLTRAGAVLDLLGYGELSDPGQYEGSPAPDAPSGASVARVEDGVDTELNRDDWAVAAEPTPGAANHPDMRLRFGRAKLVLSPSVCWPGEPFVARASVRSSGRLPLFGARWRIACDLEASGSWVPGAAAPGVDLAPGESASVSLSLVDPAPGARRVRLRLEGALGEDAALSDTVAAWLRSIASPVVLSEIAFHNTGSGEWIEIWAREPIEDVGSLTLADAASSPRPIDRGSAPRSLAAGSYLVVAQDPAAVRSRCGLPDSIVVGVTGGWPSLNDGAEPGSPADMVALALADGVPVDAMTYAGGATVRDGSLERLSFDLPSGDPGSWSECVDANGATPGRANSLHAPAGPSAGGHALLVTATRVLSVHARGSVPIVFRATEAARGRRLTVRVHDLLGRPVRTLTEGQRLATDAAFVWDGNDDAGGPAPAGLYVVRAEALPEDGVAPLRSSLSIAVAGGRP